MLPIAPLMVEHRLIERMINLIGTEVERAETEQNINSQFVDAAVDFLRIYADRCHHGKEEDILFRELNKKKLPYELKEILLELIEDHKISRKSVAEIIVLKSDYLKGDRDAFPVILDRLRFIVSLYPGHIEKEDRHFFLPCMQYFTKEEKDKMFQEESEFNMNLIHQIYKERVSEMEKNYPGKTEAAV